MKAAGVGPGWKAGVWAVDAYRDLRGESKLFMVVLMDEYNKPLGNGGLMFT